MQAVMRPTCAPTTQPIQPPTLAPMRAKKVLISISSRPAFGASCDHGGRGVGRTIGQSPRQALSSAIRLRSQSRGPPWPRVGSESRTTSATDRTRRPITGLELEGLPQGGAEGSRTPGFTTLSSRYDIRLSKPCGCQDGEARAIWRRGKTDPQVVDRSGKQSQSRRNPHRRGREI